jgi:uncharacterized protein YjeT (DUF2065 family)
METDTSSVTVGALRLIPPNILRHRGHRYLIARATVAHGRLQRVRVVLLTLLDTAIAAVRLVIGVALLLYPRQIARYYADHTRNRTVGPIRVIARPLARYIESPANIWSLRLTGIVWIAMGAFVLYFLRFA